MSEKDKQIQLLKAKLIQVQKSLNSKFYELSSWQYKELEATESQYLKIITNLLH